MLRSPLGDLHTIASVLEWACSSRALPAGAEEQQQLQKSSTPKLSHQGHSRDCDICGKSNCGNRRIQSWQTAMAVLSLIKGPSRAPYRMRIAAGHPSRWHYKPGDFLSCGSGAALRKVILMFLGVAFLSLVVTRHSRWGDSYYGMRYAHNSNDEMMSLLPTQAATQLQPSTAPVAGASLLCRWVWGQKSTILTIGRGRQGPPPSCKVV